MTNNWLTDLEEEVLTPNVALRLQYKLIKYIAEFLESQQDRYNLCFVNKAWTPAAINVLWSEPIFKTPDSIYYFLRVVKQSKQRALRIRVLNLCAPEGNNVNSFAPVLCSDHIEHKIMSTYFISKPNLLTNLVRLCENLRKIKVYGWNLSDNHIQSLPQYCPELKEILVIGNNQLTHKAFHSLMSCISDLRVLDLDGVFKLSDNFAEALAIKCPSLCSLKLSTKEISEKGFDTLATKLTKLNNLILQNCSNLTDNNIERFAERNPRLQNLQLLGDALTIRSFKVAMHLKELIHFDLRCLKEVLILSNEIEWLRPICHNLRIIILENLPIDDDTISAITVHCKKLEKIAFSRCPYITNNSINSIAENETRLNTLDLLECRNITDASLKCLGRKLNHSLTHIIIDSCGSFVPEAIHWFVKVSPKLEKIVFNRTPSIINSFVYQFSTERQKGSHDSAVSHQKCTIENENINKLAHFNQDSPHLPFSNNNSIDGVKNYNYNQHVIQSNHSLIPKNNNNKANSYDYNHNKHIIQSNYSLIPKNSNHNPSNKTMKIPEDKLDALSSELGLSPDVVSYQCMSPQSMIANEFQNDYFQNMSNTKHSFSDSSSNDSQFRRGSWTTVIKKTHSCWSSINIKLPSLHYPHPTTAGATTNIEEYQSRHSSRESSMVRCQEKGGGESPSVVEHSIAENCISSVNNNVEKMSPVKPPQFKTVDQITDETQLSTKTSLSNNQANSCTLINNVTSNDQQKYQPQSQIQDPRQTQQIQQPSQKFVGQSSPLNIQQEEKVYNEQVPSIKQISYEQVAQARPIVINNYDNKIGGDKQVTNDKKSKSSNGYASLWNNPLGSEDIDKDILYVNLPSGHMLSTQSDSIDNDNVQSKNESSQIFLESSNKRPTNQTETVNGNHNNKSNQFNNSTYSTNLQTYPLSSPYLKGTIPNGSSDEKNLENKSNIISNNNSEFTSTITHAANSKTEEKNDKTYQIDNSPVAPISQYTPQIVTDSIYISESYYSNSQSNNDDNNQPPGFTNTNLTNNDQSNSVDLGAWGSLSIDKSSTWESQVKWVQGDVKNKITEPETNQLWGPVKAGESTTNNVEESTTPVYFEKKQARIVNNELDEGWGSPPTQTISWNDSRQGSYIEMIEEQSNAVYWTKQNGVWLNATEEDKVSSQKPKEIELSAGDSDDISIKDSAKISRTELQGIELLNSTLNEIRETRKERRFKEANSLKLSNNDCDNGDGCSNINVALNHDNENCEDYSASAGPEEHYALSAPVSQEHDDYVKSKNGSDTFVKTGEISILSDDWNLDNKLKKKTENENDEKQVVQVTEDNILIDLFDSIEREIFTTGQNNNNGNTSNGSDDGGLLLLKHKNKENSSLIILEENARDRKVISLSETNVSHQNNIDNILTNSNLETSSNNVVNHQTSTGEALLFKTETTTVLSSTVEIAEKGPSPNEQLRMDDVELESKRPNNLKHIKLNIETPDHGMQCISKSL
nr:1557_t:CDS:2 [Entrophospora candida]